MTLPRCILLAACALVIGLGCSTVYRSSISSAHRTDFTVYTAASRAVLDGTHLYDAHNSRNWYYMYLPIFAVVMIPFALLNTFSASLLWYLISVSMLVHSLMILTRLTTRTFPALEMDRVHFGALAMLAVLLPAMSGMARGQISVLILYLVTLGIGLIVDRRPSWAGFALAGAIVLKIAPVLLLGWYVLQKQWKALTATLVWLVVLVLVIPSAVLGPAKNLALLTEWVNTIALPTRESGGVTANSRFEQMIDPRNNRNQSLQATAIRVAAGKAIDRGADNEPLARGLATSVTLVLLGISAWACLKTRQPLLQAGVLVLLILLLPPVSWFHSHVLLLVPVSIALGGWLSAPETLRGRMLGAGYVACLLGSLLMLFQSFAHFGSQFWGTLALWLALIGALLMETRGKETSRVTSREAALTP